MDIIEQAQKIVTERLTNSDYFNNLEKYKEIANTQIKTNLL